MALCGFWEGDFDCSDFDCCQMVGPFICCPSCHNASTSVVRIGSVGVPGIKDSRRFLCEACGVHFTSMGETFWEAHGRLRDV